jgi:hypothetical protein
MRYVWVILGSQSVPHRSSDNVAATTAQLLLAIILLLRKLQATSKDTVSMLQHLFITDVINNNG